MKIYYAPVIEGKGVRKVFINGKFYANLTTTLNGDIIADAQHPDVHLEKLFIGAQAAGIGVDLFGSYGFGVTIS